MRDHVRSIAVRFRRLSPGLRRWALAATLLSALLLVFLVAPNRDSKPGNQSAPFATGWTSQNHEARSPDGPRSPVDGAKTLVPLAAFSEDSKEWPGDSAGLLKEPRIAYSAELSVATKEFAHSRSSMEDILDRHRGYVAKLRMVGQPSGSILSATLRIPSSEYRSALADLKSVGNVEHEEESADEVTQQHNDLEARLTNAQNEERRLQQILQNRVTKTNDLNPIEGRISLLRGEIERMERERNGYVSPIAFANVFFSMREERTPPAETLGSQLRNAAGSGLLEAFNSFSAILLSLMSRGPLLFLWAVLLYFPARFI